MDEIPLQCYATMLTLIMEFNLNDLCLSINDLWFDMFFRLCHFCVKFGFDAINISVAWRSRSYILHIHISHWKRIETNRNISLVTPA